MGSGLTWRCPVAVMDDITAVRAAILALGRAGGLEPSTRSSLAVAVAETLRAALVGSELRLSSPLPQPDESTLEEAVRSLGDDLGDDTEPLSRYDDTGQVVRRAVKSATNRYRSKGHELTVDLAETPLWVEADPVRLEQVAENLLTNAAKYTSEGGHIEVRTERRDEEALLVVEDDGGASSSFSPRRTSPWTAAAAAWAWDWPWSSA